MSGKIKTFIVVSVMALGIFAFMIASAQDNNTVGNTTNENATANSAMPNAILPSQYYTPDIELQTNYISDDLEAGQTYVYKVQVKNVGKKDVTIEPILSSGYPILYQTSTSSSDIATTAESDSLANDAPVINDVSVDNTTFIDDDTVLTGDDNVTVMSEDDNTSGPIPIIEHFGGAKVAASNGVASAVAIDQIMPFGNGQAFSNDAIKISAPSTIAVGDIVDMTITVIVPDNATGNYYSSIDMNVNDVEGIQYNPQLSLNFNVINKLMSPYTKTFNVPTDSKVEIELTADVYNSNQNIRVSPQIEAPSFDFNVKQGNDEVNFTLTKITDNENVGIGTGYPAWTSSDNYQNFGSRYTNTYTADLTAGDYKLSILPKGITNFGYTITQTQ